MPSHTLFLNSVINSRSSVRRPIATGADPENVYQSPLNFDGPSGIASSGKTLSINYLTKATGEVFNNGHGSPQIAFTPGDATVTYDGKTYALLQVHFHSPSEETINGEAPALDAHFVHASDDQSLLVIGVMFDAGSTPLPLLTTALDNEDGFTADAPKKNITIPDLSSAIPKGDFYTFQGSLTTPPCTGGLQWFVATEPQSVTADQIKALKAVGTAAGLSADVGNARRPVQPLNGRDLTITQASSASRVAAGVTAIVAAAAMLI